MLSSTICIILCVLHPVLYLDHQGKCGEGLYTSKFRETVQRLHPSIHEDVLKYMGCYWLKYIMQDAMNFYEASLNFLVLKTIR